MQPIDPMTLGNMRANGVRTFASRFYGMQRASVSRTANLTKPNFKYQAKRFLRWRRKRRK